MKGYEASISLGDIDGTLHVTGKPNDRRLKSRSFTWRYKWCAASLSTSVDESITLVG